MKSTTDRIRRSVVFLGAALALGTPVVWAQTSGLLQLSTIQVEQGTPVQFTFTDNGTGSTNYAVEFRSGLETSAAWEPETNAVITSLGGGAYSVEISSAQSERGFYRVVGLGGSVGPIIIDFSTAGFQVIEGDTAQPMLVLNQPFHGVVYYTVSGTAMSGDYQALSGQVTVNGTTAVIPVSFTDNNMIGQLKYLTLRLDAGPGYQLGTATSTTITIEENDAEWRGSFITDNATLGFTLMIDESNGMYQATLKGNGSGFFPTGENPATIALTANSFSATATGIPLAASTTLLNTPGSLTLDLSAMNGVTNQSVSETHIEGTGQLIAHYAGQSQLDTTNLGTFLLLKPPVTASTNQVQLVNAP